MARKDNLYPTDAVWVVDPNITEKFFKKIESEARCNFSIDARQELASIIGEYTSWIQEEDKAPSIEDVLGMHENAERAAEDILDFLSRDDAVRKTFFERLDMERYRESNLGLNQNYWDSFCRALKTFQSLNSAATDRIKRQKLGDKGGLGREALEDKLLLALYQLYESLGGEKKALERFVVICSNELIPLEYRPFSKDIGPGSISRRIRRLIG